MEINLGELRTITLVEAIPAKTIETDVIERGVVKDDPNNKTIEVFIKIATANPRGQVLNLILWKDNDYDTIGNWTDEDVEERIKELL